MHILHIFIFLLNLVIHNAFGEVTTTYNYNIGLLYEKYSVKNATELAAQEASSDHLQIKIKSLYVQPDNTYECLKAACNYFVKYPTVAIFGPTSKVNVDGIHGLSSAKEIPHILTEYVGPLGRTQLSFYPNVELLTRAYIDILSSMNWKKFTIIHTSESRTKWGNFMEAAQEAGFIFEIEILNLYHFTNMTGKLKKLGRKKFVINCLNEEIMTVLHLFQNSGMITNEYSYLFTGIDYNKNISSFKHSGVDIIKMQLLSSKELQNFETYSEMSSVTQALYYDAVQMFANSLKDSKPIQNVSLDCRNGAAWASGGQLLNHLLKSSYKGITGEIRFGPDKYRNELKLYVNKLKSDGIKEVGTWDSVHGVTNTQQLNKIEKTDQDDWRKTPLTVVTRLIEPYAMIKESPRTLHGNDRYKGFVIDVMDAIAKVENFTYVIVINSEGNGAFHPVRHSWTGIIADILEKRADLAISDITITSDRSEAVEFTQPIIHTGITILFQKPQITPPPFYHFARPFAKDFWIAIIVAFGAVVTSLFITGRLCESEWQKQNPNSKYVINQLTFLNTVWFVVGSFFRQNTQVKIRSVPGRIIAGAWWLFSFLIFAMYLSALMAHRIKYEKSVLFTDIKSLVSNAKKHDIRYGALMHGSTMNFFKESNDPLHQDIYRHMMDNPEDIVPSTRDAVQLAETSRYAYFTEEATIDYITERHCVLAKYGGTINQNAFGIAMTQNSIYSTPINSAILKLRSMGKFDELKRKWWKNDGFCNVMEDEEVAPLELEEISGLVLIILFGVAWAIISVIIEFSVHTLKLSKKLKISFVRAVGHEIKQCFKGNTKKIKNPYLITKPIPEDEEHATTSDAIELS